MFWNLKNHDLFVSPFPISEDVAKEIEDFAKRIPIYEVENSLIVLLDGKSNAFYCECAVIDPDKIFSRELEPENFY